MSGKEWIVESKHLSVRLTHAIDAPKIGQIDKGHVFEPISERTHWLEIPFKFESEAGETTSAWIEKHKTFVDEQGGDGAVEYVVAQPDVVVRAKPDDEALKIGDVAKGDILVLTAGVSPNPIPGTDLEDGMVMPGWVAVDMATGASGFIKINDEKDFVIKMEHVVEGVKVAEVSDAQRIVGSWIVKAAKINVFGGPRKSSEILGHITQGHVVHPIGMEGAWLKVAMADGAAWMLSHEPLVEEVGPDKWVVLKKKLPVKNAAEKKGSTVGYVKRGEKFMSSRKLGSWLEVELANGAVGWVQLYKAEFIEKLPDHTDEDVDASVLLELKYGVALSPHGHWIVHSDSLNVHQAAIKEAQVLGQVTAGHVFSPLQVQVSWIQLFAPDGSIGWCMRHKTVLQQLNEMEMKAVENVPVYTAPEAKSKKAGKAPKGTTITLCKPLNGEQFAQVITPVEGWVMIYDTPEYIEQIDYEVGGPKKIEVSGNWIVESNSLNVREAPTLEASIFSTLKKGDLIHPLLEQGSWLQLSVVGDDATAPNKTGWVQKWKPWVDERAPNEWEVMSDVQMMARAATDAVVVTKLKQGQKLKGVKRKALASGEWVELVRDSDQATGWVLIHDKVYVEYVGAGRLSAYAGGAGGELDQELILEDTSTDEVAEPEPEVDMTASIEAVLLKKKRIVFEDKERVTRFEARLCKARGDELAYSDPKNGKSKGSMRAGDCTCVRITEAGDDAPADEGFVVEGLHVEKGQNVMFTFLCSGSDTDATEWIAFLGDRGWPTQTAK